MQRFVKLIPIFFLSIGAFGLNNMFPIPDWYDQLRQEAWTLSLQQVDYAEMILYLLSGLGFWLIWGDRRLGLVKWTAFSYFGILLFSSLWSLLFFGLQSPFYAFMNMAVLTAFVFLTTLQFYRYNKLAAYLMLPCIGGALFFTVHNFQLFRQYAEMFSA